jgi:hypothetical protein
MPHHQKRDWRRTSFRRLNGSIETAHDDWTLFDVTGRPVARIYRYAFGPNAGLWSWLLMVAPDGTAGSGRTGMEASAREARAACEARVPATPVERASA